jgi:hypothetical protein
MLRKTDGPIDKFDDSLRITGNVPAQNQLDKSCQTLFEAIFPVAADCAISLEPA